MRQPTTSATPLLTTFRTLIDAHRPAVRQERCFQRFVVLIVGLLCAVSRHTLTQVLVSLGLGELDWSGAYRLFSQARLDYAVLGRCFLRETLVHVALDDPYLVAVDGLQIPHESRRLPGTSWLHNPLSPPFKRGIHRAQRFSHLAWLTPPTDDGDSRALPLRLIPAFPAKAVRPDRVAEQADWQPRTEWQAGRDQLQWLRTELDAAGRAAQWALGIGDGVYSTAKLWAALPERVSLLAGVPKIAPCTPGQNPITGGVGPGSTGSAPRPRRLGCTNRTAGPSAACQCAVDASPAPTGSKDPIWSTARPTSPSSCWSSKGSRAAATAASSGVIRPSGWSRRSNGRTTGSCRTRPSSSWRTPGNAGRSR